MAFEWDDAKNTANVRKRGIAFEEAIEIFNGQFLDLVDDRKDYGEIRRFAVGVVADRMLVVVYTIRRGDRRIISARRANSRERKKYSPLLPRRSEAPQD